MKFLHTQFSPVISDKQFVFDVFFGICAPMACVGVDLSWLAGMISNSKFFSTVSISTCILCLGVWLFLNSRIRPIGIPLIAGVLALGTACAGYLAMVVAAVAFWGFLLTLELGGFDWTLAVLACIGFVPLFTVFVYLRNTVRALRASTAYFRTSHLLGITVFTLLAMLIFTITTTSQ